MPQSRTVATIYLGKGVATIYIVTPCALSRRMSAMVTRMMCGNDSMVYTNGNTLVVLMMCVNGDANGEGNNAMSEIMMMIMMMPMV